jgi:rhodanese-related sulfurtransferase
MSAPAGPPAIDVDRAAASACGHPDVVLLDIREHQEWMAGHAPTARHLPMSELSSRAAELPRHARLVSAALL